MGETRTRRRADNEARFRDANETIEATAERLAVAEPRPYLCECVDPRCTEIVRLDRAAYRAVRARATRFLVAPGHEDDAVDMVVERHGSHVVVDKPPSELFLG